MTVYCDGVSPAALAALQPDTCRQRRDSVVSAVNDQELSWHQAGEDRDGPWYKLLIDHLYPLNPFLPEALSLGFILAAVLQVTADKKLVTGNSFVFPPFLSYSGAALPRPGLSLQWRGWEYWEWGAKSGPWRRYGNNCFMGSTWPSRRHHAIRSPSNIIHRHLPLT